MEYCTVQNSTDDATFAAQKKNQGTLHSIYLYFIYDLMLSTTPSGGGYWYSRHVMCKCD
jgi:hypothetical protein